MIYRGFELDPFQARAIEHLTEGASVLVSAPTGNGKTVIADFVVERALSRNRAVVYTAPIKSLSNQKFRDWSRLHGAERVGLVTGDLVIRRDAPCRVMTTEILRNMLLTGDQLPDLDAVIIDEIHFLDDRERGTTWEEILIYLPKHIQILGLSATLKNIRTFAAWLGEVRGAPVRVVEANQRIIPLQFFVFNRRTGPLAPQEFAKEAKRLAATVADAPREKRRGEGRGRDRQGGRDGRRGGRREDGEQRTEHSELVELLYDDNKLPCLYFAFSRKSTENYARELGRRHQGTFLSREEERKSQDMLDEFSRTDTGRVLDRELRELYTRGIAFHHAGLNVQLKALVEELYEARLLKVLYCTSTFALGINMPARSACFDALMKYDGQTTRPLTSREFMQKAGRAGRRGLDTEGNVYIRMEIQDWPRAWEAIEGYLAGRAEPVRSSFSLSFHSIVNLLHRNPMERIRDIVQKSFLSWSRQMEAERMLQEADQLAESGGKKSSAIDKLRRQAESTAQRSWDELQRKVAFLQQIGYLDEKCAFNAGGRVLMHIQIEEIFVTELVLAGLLEDLPVDTLFGLLCAVNKEFPRDARFKIRISGVDLEIAKAANRLRNGPVVTQAEKVSGIDVTWCPDMIPFGRLWAEGRSLSEIGDLILAATDLTGDLVGAFRRAKDLIGQLRDVYRDDPTRSDELHALLQRVSRDEVLVVD